MNWYTFLKLADAVEDSVERKSIKTLSMLISKHDCPYAFAAAAMRAISDGDIMLKRRGAANARELINIWYLVRKRQEERERDSGDLLRAG